MPIGVGTAVQIGGAALSALSSSRSAQAVGQAQAAAGQAAAAGVSHAKQTQQFHQSNFERNAGLYGMAERNRARLLDEVTPERIESQSLQASRKTYQGIANRIKASAKARGLSDKSGLTQSQLFQLDVNQAALEADIRYSSVNKAIESLTAGIQPGLQREAQLTGAINQASGQVVSGYSNLAQTQLNIAQQRQQAATDKGSTAGNILGLGGDGAGFASLVGNLDKAFSFGGSS